MRTSSAPLSACGAVLAALAVVGLAHGHGAAAPPPPVPADPRAVPEASAPQVERLLEGRPVDVNRASEADLRLLPRIGPTLAARIVAERARGGPFRSVDDLGRVRGIGPRTIERLAPFVAAHPP